MENFNIEKSINRIKNYKNVKNESDKEKMNKFIYNNHHLTTKNIIQQKK